VNQKKSNQIKISVKKRAERERVEQGMHSHQLNFECIYVKVIFITEKWSGQGLLRPNFFLSV